MAQQILPPLEVRSVTFSASIFVIRFGGLCSPHGCFLLVCQARQPFVTRILTSSRSVYYIYFLLLPQTL